jgi:succinyl-diaminopimelate desuccinylase
LKTGKISGEDRNNLLAWIAQDRAAILSFLRDLVRAKSPNPPGDTRLVARLICDALRADGIAYETVDNDPRMPNIVAAFDGALPGKHLVLNAHMDCFPVAANDQWCHDPWSGDMEDGKIWGRGAADMKAGLAISTLTVRYLSRLRHSLKGRLTFTAVSDEERFGPNGAIFLLSKRPDVLGDCCLSAEPSSPHAIRFGEKGHIWLRFRIATRGGHSAYPHTSQSSTRIAADLIRELYSLEQIKNPVGQHLRDVSGALDLAHGAGASLSAEKVTVNIGKISGGTKVNMIPSECSFEVDFRLPLGLDKCSLLKDVARIVDRYPEAVFEEFSYAPPNWSDPDGEMPKIIKANAALLFSSMPRTVSGLGSTDTRLWRARGVPAYIYGPHAHGMGSVDEYVNVKEFLDILKVHVLSSYDFLHGEE